MKVLLTIFLLIRLNYYVKTEPLSFARDPLYCYECDSSKDKHCGDKFNWTEPKFTRCNGRCVKLKYMREDGFYYRRTCINQIKDFIHIRYTVDVCYSTETTETSDQGAFCLCEDHYCNTAMRNAIGFSWMSILFMFFNFFTIYSGIFVS